MEIILNLIKSFYISITNQVACHYSLALLISVAILAGCSHHGDRYTNPSYYARQQEEAHPVGPFKTSTIANQIDSYYRGTHPGPIGITTFVNIDDLYTSSTFGRLYAEQLMSELTMRGFDVVELRHSDALHFLSDTGEFALSRDTASIRRERDLGGIIAGTYVVSPVKIYVNARLINPTNSRVVSAGSVELDKTMEVAKMLRGGPFSGTLERIPVRHLGHSSFPMMSTPAHIGRFFDMDDAYPRRPFQGMEDEQTSVAPRLKGRYSYP